MAALRLNRFLADLSKRPWQWGTTDCLMVLADWIEINRGIDLAAKYLGTYEDEESCGRILARAGGLRRLVSRELYQYAKTDVPSAGDVAVVRAQVMRRGRVVVRDTGAICVGPGAFAIMTCDLGLVVSRDLTLVCAWKL